MLRNKIYLIVIMLFLITTLSGCMEKINYSSDNPRTKECYDISYREDGRWYREPSIYEYDIQSCNEREKLESYKFVLKEMKQKDLIKGEVRGSFLLIGGSVYGYIEEEMYLVVTYFDPRVNAYKITKFNLEQIEINTISIDEPSYFRYEVPIDYQWGGVDFDNIQPKLYLQEGWTILT